MCLCRECGGWIVKFATEHASAKDVRGRIAHEMQRGSGTASPQDQGGESHGSK